MVVHEGGCGAFGESIAGLGRGGFIGREGWHCAVTATRSSCDCEGLGGDATGMQVLVRSVAMRASCAAVPIRDSPRTRQRGGVLSISGLG